MKTFVEQLIDAERSVVVSHPQWVGESKGIMDGMRVFEYRHDVHVVGPEDLSLPLISLFRKIKDPRGARYENCMNPGLMLWDAVSTMHVTCLQRANAVTNSTNPHTHPFKLAQRHNACQICVESVRNGAADPLLTESLEFLISLFIVEHEGIESLKSSVEGTYEYLSKHADHTTDTMVHQHLRHGKKSNGKKKK